MTHATVQCEVCSKTRQFANATVKEMHGKSYICEGCEVTLIMLKKTEFTLIGTPLAGFISLENVDVPSISSN